MPRLEYMYPGVKTLLPGTMLASCGCITDMWIGGH